MMLALGYLTAKPVKPYSFIKGGGGGPKIVLALY